MNVSAFGQNHWIRVGWYRIKITTCKTARQRPKPLA